VLIAPYVNFRKSIVGATNKKYDIVIAQRVLSEFDSHHSRTDVIKLLWERTNKYLILIESNSSEHFKALMHARAFILLMGIKFDTKSLAKYLLRNGIMTTEINNMLDNPDASLLEKYNFLKSVSYYL
jgi:ribosomal protein RSM22 (predicted rRNA methylase)